MKLHPLSHFFTRRVNRLMIEHLSVQCKPPRGGLDCFFYPYKTWTSPISAFSTLKIIKKWNRIEKIVIPQSGEGQELTKTIHWTIPRRIPEHSKFVLYVALMLLEVQNNLKNFKWHSYSTLNRFKWIRNMKVLRFESKRGPKRKKKKKKLIL
jgi:hypothetical protein